MCREKHMAPGTQQTLRGVPRGEPESQPHVSCVKGGGGSLFLASAFPPLSDQSPAWLELLRVNGIRMLGPG